MSPEPLKIDRLVQGSLLRVNEEGVEAVSITEEDFTHVLSVSGRTPRTRHIAFNRPFGAALFDGTTGAPLFMSWQSSAPRPD
jgi:serine protease inhibitor